MAGDLDTRRSRPRALPRSSAFLALMSRARLARSWACSQVIMESPCGCSRVSCVCDGERVAPALLVPQARPGSVREPLRGRGCGHRPGNALPRERPPRLGGAAHTEGQSGSPPSPRSRRHVDPWIRGAGGGRQFPPPAPLTSRRLRSAGCSRKERLSRYCHRGLSSGGSRCFSLRNRCARLPAGKAAGSGPGAPGRQG